MMKNTLLTILTVLVFAYALKVLFFPSDDVSHGPEQTVLQRVIGNDVIRCAYASYPVMLDINPNTGELSGIFYDIMTEIGKRADIDVKWVEEVGYGNINQGLVTGRYDLFCAGLWPSTNRARNTVFSQPLFYDPVTVWVRHDDARFDDDLTKLNAPEYKISVIDGDANQTMADALFPQAGRVSMSHNQTIADQINQVTSGRADAVFTDLITGMKYIQNNPESIKNVQPGKPVFMYPLTIGMKEGAYGMKTFLDTAIRELKDDGTIEQIIKNHMGENSDYFYFKQTKYAPY